MVAPSVAVGVSGLITRAQIGLGGSVPMLRQSYGGFLRAGIVPTLGILAEGDVVLSQGLGTGVLQTSSVTWTQLDWEPIQGFHVMPAFETWKQYGDIGGVATGEWLTLDWFPWSHVELRIDVFFRQQPQASGTHEQRRRALPGARPSVRWMGLLAEAAPPTGPVGGRCRGRLRAPRAARVVRRRSPLARRVVPPGARAGAPDADAATAPAAVTGPGAPSRPASAAAPPTPPPAPVPAEPPLVSADAGRIPLTDRLRLRRELIRGLTALKGELAGCPATPMRPSAGGRAALVLDLQGVGNGARVLGTTLEADIPVNDRFVSCVSGVLQGKTLPATGVTPGARMRFFIPLGLAGNTLGLSSASLVEGEDVAPR